MGVGSGSFWWEALGSPVSMAAGAAAVLLAVVGAVVLRAVARLGWAERRRWGMEAHGAQPGVPTVVGMPHGSSPLEGRGRVSGETRHVSEALPRPSPWKRERRRRGTDGTATIEFALMLPILLFVILALTQTMLLMGGNLFVHYAAFAATRSAIVQVPALYPDEPANTYRPDSRKHDAIFRSAVFALLPVCGREGTSGVGFGGRIAPERVVAGFRRFFEGYGEPAPRWVETQLAERVAYGSAHTRVEVSRAVPAMSPDTQGPGEGRRPAEGVDYVRFEPVLAGDSVSPREAIAVRVDHRLNLPVPYVNRLFASGAHANGRDRYIGLDARAVLTNEGVMDELPPEPELPRIPPE